MTHAPLLTPGSPLLATGEGRARSHVLRPVLNSSQGAGSVADSSGWCVPGADFMETAGVELGGVSPIEEAASDIVAMLDNWVTPEEVTGLTPAEVIGVARAVEVLSRKLDSLKVVTAAELQARDAVEPRPERISTKLGCRNTVELLQRVTLVSAREVRQRLRLGEAIKPNRSLTGELLPGKFPVLTDALQSGDLSIDAGLTIAGALQGAAADTSREMVAGAERSLVETATGISLTAPDDAAADSTADEDLTHDRPYFAANHADVLREVAQVWEQALNQDGKFSDKEILQRRGLRFGRLKNGLIPVRGDLVPETASLLANVLDAINSPLTNTTGQLPDTEGQFLGSLGQLPGSQGLAADAALGADGKPASRVRFVPVEGASGDSGEIVDIDQRTPDQKRHDAFAALVTIAAGHEDVPAVGGAPVTVMMQVAADQVDANGTITAGWMYGSDGGPIPATGEAIRHAACTGATQRVVQDRNGRIVELGNLQRVFNAHQRRAITMRDGGCVIPGCMTPARWCEVHHVHEHSRGGQTHTDNGVLVCFFHHRHLESSGWDVRMEDGAPQVRAPGWLDPARVWRKARSRTKPPGTG